VLQVSRIAQELLVRQVEQGHALIERASLVGDCSDYESWKADRQQWITVTAQGVGDIFGSSEQADEFKSVAASRARGQRWQLEYASDVESVRAAVEFLASLGQQLASGQDGNGSMVALPNLSLDSARRPAEDVELEQRSANGSAAAIEAAGAAGPGANEREMQIFLVYGRDERQMQAVVRLLEEQGPHEIAVMHDGPDEDRTLVEKFAGAAKSGYAIVLLTADDVGTPRLDPDEAPYFSPRARQGVVFQLGFLVGALTSRRVCVLYEHGVELPSNLDGLAYVRFDLAGAWQSKLLLELRGAGFEYDPSKLAVQRR